MNILLSSQQLLLNLSPGLLPLGAFIFSILNSWHCSLMCGPFNASASREQMNRVLLFRLGSYTTMGFVMGGLGQIFRKSLEFEILSVIGFLFFLLLTVLFIFPTLFPEHFKKLIVLESFKRWIEERQPSMRGLLFAAVPCHLLGFFYGLAAITGSPFWGAFLLFGHGVMTTPALAYTWKYTQKVKGISGGYRSLVKGFIALLVILNLLYFAGRIFYSESEIQNKVLFCF